MKELHVAVGVIVRADGCVLIAQRPAHTHLGGYWEFPGGKLEAGEGVEAALVRELREELALGVLPRHPLIRVRHSYPEHRVLLDAWRVTCLSGEPVGLQGQAIRWVHPDQLPEYTFPEANRPIMMAQRLPSRYAILDHDGNDDILIRRFRHVLDSGIELVQFRAKTLNMHHYNTLAGQLIHLASSYDVRIMLNTEPDNPAIQSAAGLHLTAARLMSLEHRPVPPSTGLGASCHNMKELCQAERIGVDFALLSPVLATPSHPNQPGMGWEAFARAVDQVNLPVYALGGLQPGDLEMAWQQGGQGIAGIRGFLAHWPD
jgi:8-oxo-dGTP diphosphatase